MKEDFDNLSDTGHNKWLNLKYQICISLVSIWDTVWYEGQYGIVSDTTHAENWFYYGMIDDACNEIVSAVSEKWLSV